MSKCCIGLGKCSNLYIYILGSIIFNILKDLSLLLTPILKDKEIIQSIYKYFGFFILGIIFLKIFRKNYSKSNSANQNNGFINTYLIFNKNHLALSKMEIFITLLICLFYVIYLEAIKIFAYFELIDLEFWTLDIFFILIFMYYYFPTKAYKHQTYSMIFIIVFDTILLIFSSTKANKSENASDNIYNKRGFLYCFITIIIFIVITLIISFAKVKAKFLMDIKFVCPYSLILYMGIFGLFLNSIFSLYVYLQDNYDKKCEKDNEEGDDSTEILNMYCYAEISNFFTSFGKLNIGEKIREIILSLFYIFFNFMIITCELFILTYLNPNYLLMSDNIYFEIVKVKSIIEGTNNNISKIIILQMTELLEFIGCSIYLEIIELRFCGLNINLKRNISERAISDMGDTINIIDNNNNESLNNDEDSDKNSDDNNDIY